MIMITRTIIMVVMVMMMIMTTMTRVIVTTKLVMMILLINMIMTISLCIEHHASFFVSTHGLVACRMQKKAVCRLSRVGNCRKIQSSVSNSSDARQ